MIPPPLSKPSSVSARALAHRRAGAALVFVLLIFAALPLAAAGRADDAAPAVRFGVFPYLPPLTIDRVFEPVVAELADAIGRPVHLRTKPSFEAFQAALADGSYDLIFVHPFFYTFAAEAAGYQPLARLDQDLVTVLLARESDGPRRIEDLRGRTLGLPPQLAAVSKIAKAALYRHGLRPGTDVSIRHFRSKASCLQAVAVGNIAACGVPRFVLRQTALDRKLGLRELFEAPPMLHFVIAAHPRLAEDDCADLRARILSWTTTPEGRRLLAERGWQGFVSADDADYDVVRSLQSDFARLAMSQ